MPKYIIKDILDIISKYIPDRMPENILNKILTNMSNRIPKTLLVLKYINIMGGIIRNI